MKKTVLLYVFCFVFSVVAATANVAEAKKLSLTITNKASEAISVAVCYMQGKDWITEGWWTFEPNESDFIELTVDAPNIYLYGQGDKNLVWGGDKKDPKTKGIPIVQDEFKVTLPAHPKGEGLETVPFKYIDTGDYSKYEYTFRP